MQAQESEVSPSPGQDKLWVGTSHSKFPSNDRTPSPRLFKPRFNNWTSDLQTPNEDVIQFVTPTSVYTWPRLLPASQMGEGPMIITRYDRSTYPTRPVSERSSPTKSWEKPRKDARVVCEPTASRSNLESPPYLLKLPRSPDSTLSVPPHVDERTSVISSPTTTDLSSNAPQSYVRPPTLRTTTSSRNTSRTLNGDDGQSNAAESCADTAPGNIAWELHIKSTTSETGEVLYICEYGGKCGYSSTKQSVKRHVLGTHLKFKPHECPYCNKHFPARAALSSHIATHTGDLPLACKYRGCDKRYSDPARRHRHHIFVHGYKPKEYKKKFRPPIDVN